MSRLLSDPWVEKSASEFLVHKSISQYQGLGGAHGSSWERETIYFFGGLEDAEEAKLGKR